MRISENIPALNAYTSLSRVNKRIDMSMRRLSSSSRINSVKDDAAGLAISNKLHDQINGLNKAGRNSMDGISAVQTAEGALQEVQDMVQRIRELSVQATNDSNEPEDRRKIQEEISSLKDEISGISDRAEFNKIKLLNGDACRLGIFSANMLGVAKCTYVSDNLPKDTLTYTIDKVGLPAVHNSNPSAVTGGIEGTLKINGETVHFETTDTPDDVVSKLKELSDRCNIDITIPNGKTWNDVKAGTAGFMMYTRDEGSSERIQISGDGAIINMLGLTAGTVYGNDAEISNIDLNNVNLSSVIKGNRIELTGTNGSNVIIQLELAKPLPDGSFALKNGDAVGAGGAVSVTGGNDAKLELTDFGMLVFQIGPNKSMEINLQIPSVTLEALGIENLSVSSFELAQKSISMSENALSKISTIRARLGAYQNRLEHTYANLMTASENTTEARSRIFDTDMAWEMTEMTKNNVISQAGISIMAQANQRPQQILQLIQ